MRTKLPLLFLTSIAWLAAHPAAMAQPADEPEAAAQPAAPAPVGPGPVDDTAVRQAAANKLLEIIGEEPTVYEVQKWALRHYKLQTGRINSMARSARLKGLIPEIEGSFDNSYGDSFTNTRDGLFPILPNPSENPNPFNYKERVASSNSQLTWRVRAVWNLDRLVFNAEALDVKSLNSLGENLIREVTSLFFNRRRVLASVVLSPPQDDEGLFFELMRLDELTATLDAMTGGRFRKRSWHWNEALNPTASKSKGKKKAKKK